MIHSDRPTVSPVANIVFALNLLCFEKWERTDGPFERTTSAKTIIITGRGCGSAEWIKILNQELASQECEPQSPKKAPVRDIYEKVRKKYDSSFWSMLFYAH